MMIDKSLWKYLIVLFMVLFIMGCGEETIGSETETIEVMNGDVVSSEVDHSNTISSNTISSNTNISVSSSRGQSSANHPDVVSSINVADEIISSQLFVEGMTEPDYLMVEGQLIETSWSCVSNFDRDAATYLGDYILNMSFEKGWTGSLEAGVVADPPCTVQMTSSMTWASNYTNSTGYCRVTLVDGQHIMSASVNAESVVDGSFKNIQMRATCIFD